MYVAIKPRRTGDSSSFVGTRPLSAVCQSATRRPQPAGVLTDPPYARKMRFGVPSSWSARESAAARRESSVPRNACVGKSGGRRTHTPPPNGEKPGRDSDEKNNNNNNNNNRTASVQRISVGYHSCAFAIENIIALQNGRQHEHMPQSSRRPWKTKIPTVATSVRRTSRSAKSRLVSTRRSEVVYAAAYHDSPYQTIIITD
ncbi:unnamed protein product [Macrosiphum euphorbiae]|uniref:Uncharacterized protein n=1 Tax=Macrosiphum euphorbiae TaxID=13131 RepID=A0AAV0VZW4_9HEMI|nr:unnamed protein product [Macrosiphum euphorbiae]